MDNNLIPIQLSRVKSNTTNVTFHKDGAMTIQTKYTLAKWQKESLAFTPHGHDIMRAFHEYQSDCQEARRKLHRRLSELTNNWGQES